MFSRVFNRLNCTNCYFIDPLYLNTLDLNTLYLNTLYLHQERVLSTEAAMFSTVAQTGQNKFHVWKGGGGVGGCSAAT